MVRELVLAGIMFGALGCQSSTSGTKTEFASGASTIGAHTAYSAYNQVYSDPNYTLAIAQLQSQPMSDIYNDMVASSTNEPVTIDGYTFSNLQDRALSLQGDYQSLADHYANQGEYWARIGFDPSGSVSFNDLESALSLMDQYQQLDLNPNNAANYSAETKQRFFGSDAALIIAKADLVLRLSSGAGQQVGQNTSTALALSGFGNAMKSIGGALECAVTFGCYCPLSGHKGCSMSSGSSASGNGNSDGSNAPFSWNYQNPYSPVTLPTKY